MASILTNVDPNRPWYKRLTMIGVILMGAAQAAQTSGVIPPGTTEASMDFLKTLSELLMVTGIYKHVAKLKGTQV